MKPDKVHFLFDATNDGGRITLHVDPHRPDAWQRYKDWINSVVDGGTDIIVINGKQRRMLTSNPETIRLIKQKLLEIVPVNEVKE
jgi:heptaprenylglyceryl phosphate synthase